MSLAIVHSRASAGILSPPVNVEVHLSKGMPRLNIVGLPETVVKESKDRVRSALLNSQFQFPLGRVTVNLSPADLPKEGGRFDLPIALGILAASKQLPTNNLSHYEFAGELALSGELRPFNGALPFAVATAAAKRQLIIPTANAVEAALVAQNSLFAANHLLEVCAHLTGIQLLPVFTANIIDPGPLSAKEDLLNVCGQLHGRRALEIAAAGNHSLLFMGPPGTGKTMLASCLPGILPPMNDVESLDVAAIYSISKLGFNHLHWQVRPFRAPHHSASSIALIGGSTPPRPGEISLAHHGVLFLDELPEFSRAALEALREPMEAGTIEISRAAHQVCFPANFHLIAAMNPCPCGYLGDQQRECRCTQEQVLRYQNRISGPLLDRIDMHVEIPYLPIDILLNSVNHTNESSASVQQRVIAARQLQLARQQKVNNHLNNEEIKLFCPLSSAKQQFLAKAINHLGLSTRAYYRILKLARTLADLNASEKITHDHLQEALSYRRLDRNSKNYQ